MGYILSQLNFKNNSEAVIGVVFVGVGVGACTPHSAESSMVPHSEVRESSYKSMGAVYSDFQLFFY